MTEELKEEKMSDEILLTKIVKEYNEKGKIENNICLILNEIDFKVTPSKILRNKNDLNINEPLDNSFLIVRSLKDDKGKQKVSIKIH